MKHVYLCTLILAVAVLTAHAQIPQTMSYQGVLSDGAGTPVANGSYDLTFAIYTAASGGTAVWTETQTVQVNGGIFSVVLGANTALSIPFDTEYWLGVAVDGGAEFTPRRLLTATAYSLNSQNVVDGAITAPKVASGQLVKSLNGLTDDVTLAAGANISIAQSNDSLIIAAVTDGGNTLDQAYDQGGPGAGATITADAGAVNIAGAGGLTVSGRLGVGTTSPAVALEVDGDAAVSGTVTAGDIAFASGDDLIPIAYGTVINGNLSNASSNVASVIYNATSERYEITFTGFSYSSTTYTTTATPVSFTKAVIITVDSLSGNLAVYLWDTSGTPTPGNFSFVIWP